MEPIEPSGSGTLAGGLFFFIWLVMMGGMIVGWIVFLISIWRAMIAHESIAANLKTALSNCKGDQR